jgi:deoxyribonucleoside regulator
VTHGLCSVLVTDEHTARALLDDTDADHDLDTGLEPATTASREDAS